MPPVPPKRLACGAGDAEDTALPSGEDRIPNILPNYTPEQLASMTPEQRREVKAALRREKNRASAAASRARREDYNAKLEREVSCYLCI
jgi:bZIP Maf transcription factor